MSNNSGSRVLHVDEVQGTIRVSGAKNAALPLLAATLLAKAPQSLVDVPLIGDVTQMMHELRALGARVLRLGERVVVVPDPDCTASRHGPNTGPIRASILLLAPQLVRTNIASVPLPGGCRIGARPIDAHLQGLGAFGAEVFVEGDRLVAHAPHGLHGADFALPFPSVTATELLLMTACGAEGDTVLTNCAREPEIVALGTYLKQLGARIHGLGTSRIEIEGGHALGLEPETFVVPPDRIEAATWAIAGAVGEGRLVIENVPVDAMEPVLVVLRAAGVRLKIDGDQLTVSGPPTRAFSVTTGPWPEFPTDCQPLISVLAAVAPGACSIRETMFESRTGHVDELRALGARVRVDGQLLVFRQAALGEGRVSAQDLRCGAAMVIAAFASREPTLIEDVYQIERGYASIWRKLERLGATISVPHDEALQAPAPA